MRFNVTPTQLQYSTIQYSPMQYSTIQYSTLKYNLTVIDCGTAPGNLVTCFVFSWVGFVDVENSPMSAVWQGYNLNKFRHFLSGDNKGLVKFWKHNLPKK